jgi:hypothetical protein
MRKLSYCSKELSSGHGIRGNNTNHLVALIDQESLERCQKRPINDPNL